MDQASHRAKRLCADILFIALTVCTIPVFYGRPNEGHHMSDASHLEQRHVSERMQEAAVVPFAGFTMPSRAISFLAFFQIV